MNKPIPNVPRIRKEVSDFLKKNDKTGKMSESKNRKGANTVKNFGLPKKLTVHIPEMRGNNKRKKGLFNRNDIKSPKVNLLNRCRYE